MTRWIPLLIVAAASVPSVRAADRPLLLSLSGFPAPALASPTAGLWEDPGGQLDLIPRGDFFEGGCPAGRGCRGLHDSRESSQAAGDARARAEARFAHAFSTLAAIRARQGDLRGAIELLKLASDLCGDERIRAEIRRSLAIYRDEQNRRPAPIFSTWATIDGLPLQGSR